MESSSYNVTEVVYKYCDQRGIDILRNRELKITPPNQFNDPFEFAPRVTCSNPPREVKRLLKDKNTIREMYLEAKADRAFVGSFRNFRQRFEKARPFFTQRLIAANSAVSAQTQKEFQDNVSAELGVLCMSSRRDSIVMWGHYCDKHRGLVVGFDKSLSIFKSGKGLRCVNYVQERVIYDSSWNRGGKDANAFADQLIFSKNCEWSYEEELRQLFKLEGLRNRPLADGVSGYFLPIPHSAIVSVMLGAKSSKQLEEAVKTTLRDRPFAHVIIKRAALHDTKFSLV